MSAIALKSSSIVRSFDWSKVAAYMAILVIAMIVLIEPAFAFAEIQGKLNEKTQSSTETAKKVLLAAAVLSLVIAAAPMLWGQVKTKWLITGCSACVLFGLASVVVSAFSS